MLQNSHLLRVYRDGIAHRSSYLLALQTIESKARLDSEVVGAPSQCETLGGHGLDMGRQYSCQLVLAVD